MSRHFLRQRIYDSPSPNIRHIHPRAIIVHSRLLEFLPVVLIILRNRHQVSSIAFFDFYLLIYISVSQNHI